MKKLPRHCPSLLVWIALLVAGSPAIATITPTEWQFRQAVPVTAAGLTKIAVPAVTFDGAQVGLTDLRLLDANGHELPYLLDYDLTRAGQPGELNPAQSLRPRTFHATAVSESTELTIETGTTDALDAIELETPTPYFLKAAHIEISADGQVWESLGAAVPVFRQFGAEQLRLALNRHAAAFVRVTLDDFHSRPIAFTGAQLLPSPTRAAAPALATVGTRITRRDEFAGETVLTLELDGSHVPLAGLEIPAKDLLFMRLVTVSVREAKGDVSRERVVGTGTIYRLALDGAPAQAQIEFPFDFTPATRELLVHIHNGDSPPLALDAVQAEQHPVNLLFLAAAPGEHTLLTGNAQAAAPYYDLAAFAGDIRTAPAAEVTAGRVEAMPSYHLRESLAEPPLPDVPLAGAPLDPKEWTRQKPLSVTRPGVQELELDLDVLAHARADLADLRLLHEGNQVPYLLEQPALSRSLRLTPTLTPDPKRPTVSVWRVALPQTGLPLSRVVLTSTTVLFQRQFRIFEKLTDANGRAYESTLAGGSWSRTPNPGVPETREFDLSERLGSDSLWIETDNGDNPAIALNVVQTVYPVVRLVFKVATTDGFTLAFGRESASAPRYDLSLVAAKLLTASRNVAQLAPDEAKPAGETHGFLTATNRSYFFWAALSLMVIVLLVAVAKLLPKPPAQK